MGKYRKFTKGYNQAHSESNRFKIRTNYQCGLFHKRKTAEEFFEQLKEHYGIKAELFQKKGSATSGTQVASFLDIFSQYGKAFTVQLLYRLYCKGIAWGDFYERPVDIRMQELQEYLYSMAVRDGKWHNLMYTNSELKWYQEFAKLTDVQIQQAVQRAKFVYPSSREKNKRVSFGIGGGLLLLSFFLFAVQRDISIWPFLLFSFGLIFIGFVFFRLKQFSEKI